jgi:membrane-associated protein
VALGAFLSNTGLVSAWAVFGVTWAANVGSAAGVYVAARTVGRTFFAGRMGRRLLKPDAMARIEHLYERHGTWGIFLSRFIPGARAVIPPFAGVAGLKSARALVPMILASGIWYGTLTYVAANLIPRLDDVASLVARMNWVGVAAFIVIAGVVGTFLLLRMRRRVAKRREGHSP